MVAAELYETRKIVSIESFDIFQHIPTIRNYCHSRTFESGARKQKKEGLAALFVKVGRVIRARPPVYLLQFGFQGLFVDVFLIRANPARDTPTPLVIGVSYENAFALMAHEDVLVWIKTNPVC